jgi:hypothetical protein
MADLLSNNDGRQLLYRVACFLGRSRMGRALHRNFYQAWQEWRNTGSLNLATLLGSLNPAVQDEILSIGTMLGDLGCYEGATYDNMTVYVDADNGSDDTGDGTSDKPYQTLTFLNTGHFPFFINHQVRIIIKGAVTVEALRLDHVIGPFGSLSIIGQGAPNVVNTSQGAGPFTLTSATALQPGPEAGWDLGFATTFGVDELYGKWIRFEDGACAGQALPIHENLANNIYTRAGWNGNPAMGDNFVVVEPSNSITADRMEFELKASMYNHADDRAARFNLMNLKLDITGQPLATNQFYLRNSCHSNISFCTLIATSAMSGCCILGSPLNYYFSWDSSVESLSQAGLSNLDEGLFGDQGNCGFQLYRQGWPPVSFSPEECRLIPGAEDIVGIDSRGMISAVACCGALHQSAIAYLIANQGYCGTVQQCLVSGRADGAGINIFQGAYAECNVNYFLKGRDCLKITIGDLYINQCLAAAVFTGHGIVFGRGSGRVVTHDNPATLTGAVGDVHFAGGVGTTAYPIADAQITDSLGSFFSYITTE